MKSDASVRWFAEKRELIRSQAGHDAAKFEALVLDSAFAREALELFPEDPDLYLHLRTVMWGEILLAKGGVFLIDGPPTDAQTAELKRRNAEKLAKWRARRHRG